MHKLKKIFIVTAILLSCISCSNSGNQQLHITWSNCGGEIGVHACDFSFMDQQENNWTLYDHYGSIIVLDFSAMWCGYCQKAASVAQIVQDEYKDDNVIWVTILLQNNYGQQPELEDLIEWSTAFDITTSPVLSGNTSIIDLSAQNGYNIRSWPGFVIIDQNMRIAYELFGWNEYVLQYEIEKLLNANQ